MKKIFKYLPFVILCGCEINTPSLPSLEGQSFSYEQVMQQQQQLEREVGRKAQD